MAATWYEQEPLMNTERQCQHRSLANQVAVVTGASSGIGKAVALALARSSMSLCLLDVNRDALEATAAEAASAAPSVFPFPGDLRDDGVTSHLGEVLTKEFAGIDVLVHCAGMLPHARIEDLPIEKIDALYETNFRVPYSLTRVLLSALKRRQGQVVLVSSSREPAARGFLDAEACFLDVGERLREELGPDGIRVLNICAGPMQTPQVRAGRARDAASGRGRVPEPDDVAQVVLSALLMPKRVELSKVDVRRFAEPE
jgi:NAD(P)-dependent dehydrogenase (short-subunit alcohol dehydrogenase family)